MMTSLKFGIPTLAALLATTQAAPAAQPADTGQPEWVEDAKVIARQEGIPVGEAIRRIKMEARIGALEERLESENPNTFAGLTIIRDATKFRVRIHNKGGPIANASSATDPEVAGVLDQSLVTRSLQELRQAQRQAMESLKLANIDSYSSIEIETNDVVMFVKAKDIAAAQAAFADRRALKADYVRLQSVDTFPVPVMDITGGVSINYPGGGGCTSGFVVQTGAAVKGIVTAGHCQSEATLSFGGTVLPLQNRNYGGNFDVQWHTAPGFTTPNTVNLGTAGLRAITSSKGLSLQTVGMSVCKNGRSTGYTCGKIVAKNIMWLDPAGSGTSVGPWVQVNNGLSGILCANGDSGGPAVNANAAMGLVTNCSSGAGGTELFYMPVERIFSGVGVTVRTAP